MVITKGAHGERAPAVANQAATFLPMPGTSIEQMTRLLDVFHGHEADGGVLQRSFPPGGMSRWWRGGAGDLQTTRSTLWPRFRSVSGSCMVGLLLDVGQVGYGGAGATDDG